MALLTFQHVSKTYDNVTKALQDVSFSIEEGEFVSIIGPSGAGKSTLLRCVNRLVDASQGAIFLTGRTSPLRTKSSCGNSESRPR